MALSGPDAEPGRSRHVADFIAGMGKVNHKFVIILDIMRVLSVEEMAAVTSIGASATQGKDATEAVA